MKVLGTFEITSGKLVLSDPCFDYYPEGPNDDMNIYDVPNGKWLVYIINMKHPQVRNKIRNILIHHTSLTVLDLKWEKIDTTIGVDSGLVGFFDLSHYQNNETISEDVKKQGKTWYDINCEPCKIAQTIPFGVVSNSDYGNPIYNVYGAYKDNQLVGLKIKYTEGDEVDESDGEHEVVPDDEIDYTNTPNNHTKPIRYFKLIVDGESHGRFSGFKPRQAANKALTYLMKLIGLNNNKTIIFAVQECTRGSSHKTYNYIGERIKLDDPIQIKIGTPETGEKIIEYHYQNKITKNK